MTTAMFAGAWNVAQSQSEPTPAYPAAEKHKPTTLPDRIVLTYEGDPATSQSVTWRTDTTVAQAQAQLAKSSGGPDFKGAATTVLAHRSTRQTTSLDHEAVFHSVRFTNLEPKTKYLYRVGDGTTANWSEWFEFETASTEREPFSFVYYGDAQNDIQEHWSRVARQAFSDAPDAKFFLHAGDLVDTSTNDAQWGEWFTAGGFINGMRPSLATPGNHEYSGTNLAPYWRAQFAFPDNGPQGEGPVYDAIRGTVWYVDYQGVRIISLNSNGAVPTALIPEYADAQTNWLRGVLENNPNKWTAVFFHHPIYSTAAGRDNPLQRAYFQPIFEEYGVDLVLQGHDHSYGRGNVAEGATAIAGTTVYVTSVSGPKMYEANDNNWTSNGAIAHKIGMNTQLYQVISVDGDTVSYKSKTADGKLFDAFKIHKPADGPKVITEDLEAFKSSGVGGTVPNTLALELDGQASLGAFTPGVAADYEASLHATVTSTAGHADLSIVDPSTTAPGKLVNGPFALTDSIQSSVDDAFAPVSGTPLTLHRYTGPVSNGALALRLKQSIGASEPLRTGTYAKALTLTLSTTEP